MKKKNKKMLLLSLDVRGCNDMIPNDDDFKRLRKLLKKNKPKGWNIVLSAFPFFQSTVLEDKKEI